MSRSPLRHVAIIAAGTLLYLLVGWSSLRLALTQPNASAVWPVAGLAIGVLARFGYRFWPIIFLGAFGNNLLVNWMEGVALLPATLAALGIGFGKTAAGLFGARLTRQALGFPPQLSSAQGAFRFVLFAGSIPPAISAGVGVLSLWLTGVLPAAQVAGTALTWFTGTATGILTCAPLFFIDSLRPSKWQWSRRVAAECVIVLILLVLVGQAISGLHLPAALADLPRPYMAIPLVIWIAFRLGRRGSVLAVLVLMAIGVSGTMRGSAAFPSDSREQSLLALQLFIAVVAVTGLIVSTLAHQLREQRVALAAAVEDQTARLATVIKENATLTASAVHDLQSPLSGMRNLLQLVRGSPEVFAGPEGDRLLADMQVDVERMFHLVTGALATSGPGGTVPAAVAPEPCDLRALLDRAAEGEQAHAAAKRITIHRQVPPHPVVVPTHGSMLESIVGNFLSNAVKFAAAGTAIFVVLEELAGSVKISVTDEGPGISALDRAEIFSGKQRVNGARPTADESSGGLGLYLVGQLAQRLGARVTCEMAPGGGSVFAVCLAIGESGRPLL